MVAGIAVGKSPPRQVQNPVESRYKLVIPQRLIKQPVYLGQNRSDRIVVSDLGAQDSAEASHNQRCRNPLPRDVRDDDTQVAVDNWDEVIVVSANAVSRHINAMDIQSVQRRSRGRQKTQLNISSDSQFLFQSLLFDQLRMKERLVDEESGLCR